MDIDIEKLKIPQNFALARGKEVDQKIRIAKPHRTWWVRTRSGFSSQFFVLEDDAKDVYILAPELAAEFSDAVVPKSLTLAVNVQGVAFLWPVRLPDIDGKIDSWNEQAAVAVARAETEWVRLSASKAHATYRIFAAEGDLGEPEWPEGDFAEICQKAFAPIYIDGEDHPVIKRLRGMAP